MTVSEQPVVILGAARSGTKMLRGLLGAHPKLSVVPWDINFVWKYGNYDITHDELIPSHLGSAERDFIVKALRRFQLPGTRLVEKTVGNTLRPAFVRSVLPDAKFVHLVRDGRAVAESARRMWTAPMDWQTVMRKMLVFPPAALPSYGVQYVRTYAARAAGGRGKAVSSWGPRWKGIDDDVRRLPLLEVCALQWSRSVHRSMADLSRFPEGSWMEVRYEALCADPAGEMARVFEFIGLDFCAQVEDQARAAVSTEYKDRWRSSLTAHDLKEVERQAGPMLDALGYCDRP